MWHHEDYIKQIEEDAQRPFDGIVLAVILGLCLWAAGSLCWYWWVGS